MLIFSQSANVFTDHVWAKEIWQWWLRLFPLQWLRLETYADLSSTVSISYSILFFSLIIQIDKEKSSYIITKLEIWLTWEGQCR